MKTLFVFLTATLFCNLSEAQDIIELRTGERIEAKVAEVGDKTILYRKFSNSNGPAYKLYIDEIARITYENGTTDNFNPLKGASHNSILFGDIPRVSPDELGNNIISLNVFSLLTQNITIQYERILGKNRRLGLNVPVSINMLGTSSSAFESTSLYNTRRIYYTGLDVNFYPLGQGQSRFLLGPSFRAGEVQSRGYYYTEPAIYPPIHTYTGPLRHSYFSFLVQMGFVWCPVKELNFQTTFALGTRRYLNSAPENTSLTITDGHVNFSIGYRF